MAETTVKVGQIWKDNDPRQKRFVRIVRTRQLRSGFCVVRIRRCYETGEDKPGCPETGTKIARFGKKGVAGFTLVKDAP
jgi:hypothetical protein